MPGVHFWSRLLPGASFQALDALGTLLLALRFPTTPLAGVRLEALLQMLPQTKLAALGRLLPTTQNNGQS